MSSETLALLIDGDNASPKIITGLLAEVATYGTVSVKRIYGDWTKPNLNGWKQCLLEHSIQLERFGGGIRHSRCRAHRRQPEDRRRQSQGWKIKSSGMEKTPWPVNR